MPSSFLLVTVTPRFGAGGLTIDSPPAQQAAWQPSQWRPGGNDVEVEMAAVAATYHGPTLATVLHFFDSWDACRVAPWMWSTPPPPAGTASAPSPQPPPPPQQQRAFPLPLPLRPELVSEMVLHSFGVHDTPVLGLLSLEGNSLQVHCPGIALQLPYVHSISPDFASMSGTASSSGWRRSSGGHPRQQRAATAPAPAWVPPSAAIRGRGIRTGRGRRRAPASRPD